MRKQHFFVIVLKFVFLLTSTYPKTEIKESQNESKFPRTAALEEINYDRLQTWNETGGASATDIVLDNSNNIYLFISLLLILFLVNYIKIKNKTGG